MGHGVKKTVQQNLASKNHTAHLSLYAPLCGRTVVYGHIWGVSVNGRVRAIKIQSCLAVNPC